VDIRERDIRPRGTYVIAEIGQNHNGSIDLAKSLIHMAANPKPYATPQHVENYPVDAVKLTMRHLDEECTPAMMSAEYDSPHAFGRTYGEHRAALEMSVEEHAECYWYARDLGLEFIETLCHPYLVDLVVGRYFAPHALKVASRDLTNEPLIEAIGETRLPVILSTGMASLYDIERAISIVGHDDIQILHCVSSYPASFESLNLARIPRLKQLFGLPVGYSDHSQGIVAPVCAVAMGAETIEKHITIDRTAKGSDHAGSLERDGLWRMMRDIRHAEAAIGTARIEPHPDTLSAQRKLERRVCAAADLPAGHTITEADMYLLSTGGEGVVWRDRGHFVGRQLTADIGAGCALTDALFYIGDVGETT
jgi:sialic acid synthase